MQRKTVLLCSCVTSVLVRLTLSEESVGGLYSNKLRIFIDVLDERLQGDPLQNISPKYDSPLSSKLLHRIETSAPQMDLPILLSVWNRLLRRYLSEFQEPYAAKSDIRTLLEYTEEPVGQQPEHFLGDYEWFGAFPEELTLLNCGPAVRTYRRLHAIAGLTST